MDEPPFDDDVLGPSLGGRPDLRELADEVDAIAALLRCPLGHGLTKRRLADLADELREMAVRSDGQTDGFGGPTDDGLGYA